MADVTDIESVLKTLVTQTIYPNGTIAASIINTSVRIYRGWPIPANLDADLKTGTVNVSIYPTDQDARTTKYLPTWVELPVTASQLVLTVSGNTITASGTVTPPLNACAIVNGKPYVYAVQDEDTPIRVAVGLAVLISVDTPAFSSGTVVTIPAAKHLVARVGAFGKVIREIRRQKRNFQITFWCSTPAQRDAIVPPVDLMFAGLKYINLPDQSVGRILYEKSTISDRVERENLYRRDLFYSVEYATTETQSAAQIVAELFNISGGPDPAAPLIKQFSI